MNLRKQIEDKHSFLVSLCLIVLSMLAGSLPFDRFFGLVIRTALGGAVVWSILVAGSASRRIRWICFALYVAALIAAAVANASRSGHAAAIADTALSVVAVFMIVVVARALFKHLRVTIRTVAGALCIYLLIGLVFAGIYAALSEMGNGVLSQDPIYYRDAIYFSFITQLTIGYGDIVPLGQLAKMLAVLEGLIGQIYIVTVIALLVSNLGRDRKPGLHGGEEP